MGRLYGLSASHPTQPACDLLDAQNALIAQSRQDELPLHTELLDKS
jgi:glutamine amidotransferase